MYPLIESNFLCRNGNKQTDYNKSNKNKVSFNNQELQLQKNESVNYY